MQTLAENPYDIRTMGFTWVSKQGVESDEGFRVRFTGRDTLEYAEAGNVMTLEGEDIIDDAFTGQQFGFAFYPSWRTSTWDAPHASNPINDAERLRIRNNITNALAFMEGRAVFR